MINKAILIGRLTRDPLLKSTVSGNVFCSFSIAVDNRVAKGAEKTASFINCVCFGFTANNLAKYQQKGSLIGIEGRIQTSEFVDKENKKVYSTQIICEMITFLGAKPVQNNLDNGDNGDNGVISNYDLSDEELPF